MKKLIYLLLLLPFFSTAQTATGSETQFDYGIQNLAPQTISTPTYFGCIGIDGTMGRTPAAFVTPTARTLSINGVSQDLTANRSWVTAQADTGVLTFAGLTYNSGTTINIGAVTGQIVNNETNPLIPTYTPVTYAGATNVTVTTVGSGLSSYVMLSSAGVISFQNTFPSNADRKTKIYLGKIGHPTGVINASAIGNEPDYITSPTAQVRALYKAIGFVNNGVVASANGANLNFNTATGTVSRYASNFVADKTTPNEIAISAGTPQQFLYRTQTGLGGSFITAIDPASYDVAGTITAIAGSTNQATNQYIYCVPGLGFIIQYGQTIYATLGDAIAAVGKESFTVYPSLVSNAILVGVISVQKGATALNNTGQARFLPADKFGQTTGSSAGISTATFTSVYANSLAPQITTTTALGALELKRGSAADSDNVLRISNGAGTQTAAFTGAGDLTCNSVGMRNVANTFTSSFTNANTASRTYTLPDATGTLALTSSTFSGYQTLNQASYTFAISDANSVISNSYFSTAITYTVPTNAVVAFPIGTKITINNTVNNAASTSAIAGAGVTFIAPNGLGFKGPCWFNLIKVATDTWVVNGDISGFTYSATTITTPHSLSAATVIATTQLASNIWSSQSGSQQMSVGLGGMTMTGTARTSTTNSLLDQNTFSPSTAAPTYSSFGINSVINQTGGSNGITRGFYCNPTLTSAVDYRALDVTTGSIVLPYLAKSATYSISNNDYLIDVTSGTFTATLPTAVGCIGKNYIVKNSGSGAITIATTSSQTIDGASSYSLPTQYKYVHVVSNGANWIITANN